MTDHFWVLYSKQTGFDLTAAARAVEGRGFTVRSEGEEILATWELFSFRIREESPSDAAESRAFASRSGSPGHRRGLSKCDGSMEVELTDLASVLLEVNALMKLQGALQAASRGYLFLAWNCKVHPPERTKPTRKPPANSPASSPASSPANSPAKQARPDGAPGAPSGKHAPARRRAAR